MAGTKLRVVVSMMLFILGQLHEITWAQVHIVVTSPNLPNGNQANTVMGLSEQIGSSLLGTGTPAILWGIVNSGDVTAVCQNIVNTGDLTVSITVNDPSGTTEDVTAQIENTGGCEAASDESGTEAVMVDNYGRRSALVCPSNAGSTGCGVYFTGDDVSALFNQGTNRRLLASGSSRKLLGCVSAAKTGAIIGAAVGFIGSLTDCEVLLANPLYYPMCVVGETLVTAIMAAGVGCLVGTCFPGDALVLMATGHLKQMADLDLSDKVAVRNPYGSVSYEEVYAFGHKDALATSEFLKITVVPHTNAIDLEGMDNLSLTIELSALHFAPVSSGLSGQGVVYKRAREIKVGDSMWALHGIGSTDAEFSMYNVTDISSILKQGLYNPFTMSGTIVVNGVLASVHSDWFLDSIFDALRLTHLLPAAYQVILTPPRVAYNVLGKNFYNFLYTWLDSRLNLVQFLSAYSGGAASVSGVCAILASVLLLSNKTKGHCA